MHITLVWYVLCRERSRERCWAERRFLLVTINFRINGARKTHAADPMLPVPILLSGTVDRRSFNAAPGALFISCGFEARTKLKHKWAFDTVFIRFTCFRVQRRTKPANIIVKFFKRLRKGIFLLPEIYHFILYHLQVIYPLRVEPYQPLPLRRAN